MNLLETSLNLNTHQAVVTPEMQQHTEVVASPNPAVGVASIPAPTYLGGAICVGLIGMLAVAAQAAGLKEKRVTSRNDTGASSTQLPLTVRIEQNILYITLARPALLNAINLEMAELLQQHLIAARQNSAVRAIVITGKGRAFCSGGDLKFAVQANPDTPGDSFLALTAVLHQCVEEIRTMPKPVIASVNGVAAGAGLFLALACDLRVMAKSAYLKQSNTSYGLATPAGGTFTLPRLVGIGRAMEIIMLDQPINAKSAHKLGLVNQIVPHYTLATDTQALATRVAQMPIETLGHMKQLVNQSFYHTLNEQLAIERQTMAICANSNEGREGLSAFLQKRHPSYR